MSGIDLSGQFMRFEPFFALILYGLMPDLMQATTGRIALAARGAVTFSAQDCLGTHHIGVRVQLRSSSATLMSVAKTLPQLCISVTGGKHLHFPISSSIRLAQNGSKCVRECANAPSE